MNTDIGVWVAAFLTLGIFSFLYKDNPIYRFCESVFVGVSAGYWAITFFWDNLHKKLWEGVFPPDPGVRPEYMLIFGAILGFLFLMRLVPKVGWIARWPLAFIVGATAGLYMMLFFVSNAMNQVSNTMIDLIVLNAQTGSVIWLETIGSVLVAIGVFSGLVYFFFSKEHTGAFGHTAKVGIWFLMVTFGASFGYTVMSRMSLLIGRMDFIFGQWLGMIN